MNYQLSGALLSAAILAACAETIPSKQSHLGSSAKHAEQMAPMPVIVGSDETGRPLAGDDVLKDSNGVAAAVIVTTDSAAFDSVAVKANAAVIKKSRLSSRGLATPTVTPLAAHPNLIRWVSYVAGQVAGYSAFTYNAAGVRTMRVRYSAPGIDGLWFTADDIVGGYAAFGVTQNNIPTQVIAYIAAGPDGVWFTLDDVVRRYVVELTDPADLTTLSQATYLRPGVDGLWFTADDVIRWSSKDGVNVNGDQEWTQFRTAGLDGNWATVSDNVVGHFEIEKAVAGIVNQHIFYGGPGVDLTQYTADDVVGYYHNFVRDTLGKLTQATLFRAPGVDALWFTADDSAAGCRVVDRNVAGDPTLSKGYAPGPDGVCFTADDILRGYRAHTYIGGILTNATVYSGAGVDLVWFTPDDVIEEVYIY